MEKKSLKSQKLNFLYFLVKNNGKMLEIWILLVEIVQN